MDWKDTVLYIKRDFYRNLGEYSFGLVLKNFFSKATTVNLLLHYRICHFYVRKEHRNVFESVLYYMFLARYKRLQIYCGIELSQLTEIGYGLRLPHRGSIVIHPGVKIGNNCEIMSCVTIGNNIFKSRDDVATIGDNVLICTGVKIIGDVEIGSGAVIGANSLVNRSVQPGEMVAGIPAKTIRSNDDDKYLINTDYPF